MPKHALWLPVWVVLGCCALSASDNRPKTVHEAVEVLHAKLTPAESHELAYVPDEDLIQLHHGLGMTVRDLFGMWGENPRLLSDCRSAHPDDCSMEIIERLRARLRAELPAEERAALEKLEAGMRRVRVPAREFEDAPLRDFTAFLQQQIDLQLAPGERFSVRHAPADAGERVSVSIERELSLSQLLGGAPLLTGLDIVKQPPNVLIEPYWRPLLGLRAAQEIPSIYSTDDGLREETRELVRDAAAWQRLWVRLRQESHADAAAPEMDFTTHAALVIALGRRPSGGYEVSLQVAGLHHATAGVVVEQREPGKNCPAATPPSYPTAIFLMPKEVESVSYFEKLATRECKGESLQGHSG